VEGDLADLGDVRICHQLAGPEDGPRVVYVSGSGSDLRRPPNALSSPFVERCRVLAYDHRGLGRSTTGARPPTMADFAGDLLRLLDHVGWDRCLAVGVSFGGMVLMEAAVTEPERFERCVLACTSPGGAGGASYPLHELIGLPDDERRERWIDALDDRNTDPEHRAVLRSIIESMEAAKPREPGAPFYSDGEVGQLLARRDHDCFDRLPAMSMPMLIAAGRHDGIAPPANQEAMAGQLPDARIEWFDGGHAFFVEDRTAYPAMERFLTAD
jgi:3-oxoadipate enol-lactonase